MKERPILFSGAMVRALLAGTKTQTRRLVKPMHIPDSHWMVESRGNRHELTHWDNDTAETSLIACPYGGPGDRLWVRETWMDLQGTGIEIVTGSRERYAYGADTPPGSYGDDQRKCYGLKWRPSIHMPRSVSRITLEITNVRVERLQDISEADAQAEGVTDTNALILDHAGNEQSGPIAEYAVLWESIHGPGSWYAANPWVWVVSFQPL